MAYGRQSGVRPSHSLYAVRQKLFGSYASVT